MPPEISIELEGPANGLDAAPYVEILERVLADEGIDDVALAVVLAGDVLLRQLNRDHRGKDEPTDVLAFPAGDDPGDEDGVEPFPRAPDDEDAAYLGDIAVSVEAVRRQAADAGLSFEDELRHVLVHALLHLLGHTHAADDDSRAMRDREEATLGPHIHAAGEHDADD